MWDILFCAGDFGFGPFTFFIYQLHRRRDHLFIDRTSVSAMERADISNFAGAFS